MPNKSKEEELRGEFIDEGEGGLFEIGNSARDSYTQIADWWLSKMTPPKKEGCDGLEALCAVCKSGMRIAIKEALASHQLEMEKKIEGLREKFTGASANHDIHKCGYNDAIDDTLSILKGEEKK